MAVASGAYACRRLAAGRRADHDFAVPCTTREGNISEYGPVPPRAFATHSRSMNMTGNMPMSPGRVVRHYLDTFFEKNVEKTLDCLADDVRWKVQGAADVPTVGERRGKQAVRDWLALFPVNVEPLAFCVDTVFEEGDKVVVTGEFTHRIKSTGREFRSDFAALCTVRDGKISAYNFIEDSYALWRAFQAA
jgi:uncharacterized protein